MSVLSVRLNFNFLDRNETLYMNCFEHGFSCLHLAGRDLAALVLTYTSYICLEGGSSGDPQYSLKILISKSGPVLGLIEVQGGE